MRKELFFNLKKTLWKFLAIGEFEDYCNEFYRIDYHNSSHFLLRLFCILCSKNLADIKRYFKGKRIAIVGNAESLLAQSYGKEIDSHDVVIRLNRATVVKSNSQGNKTDVWATSFNYDFVNNVDYDRAIWVYPFFHGPINYPKSIKLIRSTYFMTYKEWASLRDEIGAFPSTGISLIMFLLKYVEYASINLYGFDFFETKNLYEKWDVANTPHDFPKESDLIYKALKTHKNVLLKRS